LKSLKNLQILKLSFTELKEITSFTDRKELNNFLPRVADKLGMPHYEKESIKEMLAKMFNYEISTKPLCLSCDKINEPIVILKACAGLSDNEEKVCWLYVYQNGKILYIKELVDVVGKLDNYEEIGEGFKGIVLKHYDSFIEKIKTSVYSELKKTYNIFLKIALNI